MQFPKGMCKCPGFIKSQHVVVKDPSILISEFAQKSWIEILENDKRLNMDLYTTSIYAGNTSTVSFCQLMYEYNIPLITCVLLSCHVDLKNGRPIQICQARRNAVEQAINAQSEEEKENVLKLRTDLTYSMDRIQTVLNAKKNEPV